MTFRFEYNFQFLFPIWRCIIGAFLGFANVLIRNRSTVHVYASLQQSEGKERLPYTLAFPRIESETTLSLMWHSLVRVVTRSRWREFRTVKLHHIKFTHVDSTTILDEEKYSMVDVLRRT
jgi:hypothetical protein